MEAEPGAPLTRIVRSADPFTFDGAGRMIGLERWDSPQGATEVVDDASALAQVTPLAAYSYGANDLRTRVRALGGAAASARDRNIDVYNDGLQPLVELEALASSGASPSTLARYHYDVRGLMAITGPHPTPQSVGPPELSASLSTRYVHLGALGTTLATSAADSAPGLHSYRTDPWGALTSGLDESDLNASVFTGHQTDLSGYVYMKTRYYDPLAGRFLSQDSYLGELGSPATMDRYLYGLENPGAYVDPDGRAGIRQLMADSCVEAQDAFGPVRAGWRCTRMGGWFMLHTALNFTTLGALNRIDESWERQERGEISVSDFDADSRRATVTAVASGIVLVGSAGTAAYVQPATSGLFFGRSFTSAALTTPGQSAFASGIGFFGFGAFWGASTQALEDVGNTEVSSPSAYASRALWGGSIAVAATGAGAILNRVFAMSSFGKMNNAIQQIERPAPVTWNGNVVLAADDFARAPFYIPPNADLRVGMQNSGFLQARFKWRAAGMNFEIRWHTRSPSAPPDSGDVWVIFRRIRGNSTTRGYSRYLLDDGTWVSEGQWKAAVQARDLGTSTARQTYILDHGHFPAGTDVTP